jgi:hypothetical protein
MGLPPDENLPEVVYDTSPQVISNLESHYKERVDGRDLYPVQYDRKVVYDTSPQVVSNFDSHYKEHMDGRGLYPVQYDDTPKILTSSLPYAAGQTTVAASPVGSLPWDPVSAVEETHAGSGAGWGGAGDETGVLSKSEKPQRNQKICGFARRTFFIICLVAFLVAAIAIGGGVGGGIAASRSQQGPSTSSR